MNVQLRHLVALAAAGVGDIDGSGGLPGGADLGRLQAQVIELEGGVTQAPAEREERLAAGKQVAAVHGRLVVVVIGKLADGTREADGEFSSRIDVAEQHPRGGGSALLAQIPAFQNRRNMLGGIVDGKRPAVDQEHDGGLSGLDDGPDQLVLIADQVERIPVSQMVLRPGLAVGALVLAYHDDGDVGAPHHLHRVVNAFQLRFGIRLLDLALVPPGPPLLALGDPRTLRVNDLGGRAGPLANPIQDTHPAAGVPGVSPQVNVGRIGTDHRDGLQLREVERQQVAVVLEKHDRLLGGLLGQLLVLRAVGDAVRVVGIDIGLVEQPQAELGCQNSRNRAVDLPLRHGTLLHLVEEGAVDRAVAEIVVHSGLQRLAGRAREIGRDVVSLHQHLEPAAIGGHVALEAPLLAEHPVEQPRIDVRRNAVDLVVGSHYAAGVRLDDRGLESREIELADDSLGVVAGRGVGSTLRRPVHGEVLGGGHNVVAVDRKAGALEARDGSHGHARTEVRIFTVGFLGSAPARVARQIEHRREGLLDSGGRHLIGGGVEHAIDQRRVPGAGQSQSLWEAGGAVRHKPVQRLALEDLRDTQAGLLDQVSLDCVAQDGAVARAHLRIRAVEAEERLTGGLGVELAGGVDDLDGLLRALRGQLRDLLFERHAGQQVRDPLLDGQPRILIWGRGVLPRRDPRNQSEHAERECRSHCRFPESSRKAQLYHERFS